VTAMPEVGFALHPRPPRRPAFRLGAAGGLSKVPGASIIVWWGADAPAFGSTTLRRGPRAPRRTFPSGGVRELAWGVSVTDVDARLKRRTCLGRR
jgi:hypothetical protein